MIYAAIMKLSPTKSSSPKEKRAAESIAARELLGALYRQVFAEDLPRILKSEKGKPYPEGENSRSISISHSSRAVAVAISDDASPIGIDLEETVPEEKAHHVQQRFPFIKKRSFTKLNGITLFLAEKNGKISFKKNDLPSEEPDCFSVRWTACESLLKAEGGGLASFEKLDSLEKSAEVYSFKLDEFYISISKISTDCK